MTKIRKAVIPAAGIGSRMLPITKAQPKEMVPVVHKPVIQYVVEEAYLAGIREILIITGKGKSSIENHFDPSFHPQHISPYLDDLESILRDIEIFYTRQKDLKGLGNAVTYAESFVNDEAFALLLGDTITVPPCMKELQSAYDRYGASIIAVEEVPMDKVSLYGIISGHFIDDNIMKVQSMVEKPPGKEAPSNMAILGSYILEPELFSFIRETAPDSRGEVQLTDAMNLMVRKMDMYAYRYRGRRFDIGNKTDWLKANIELALEDPELKDEILMFIRGIR